MTIKPGNPARKQKAALHARACSLCGRCSQHHPHPLLPSSSRGLEAILCMAASWLHLQRLLWTWVCSLNVEQLGNFQGPYSPFVSNNATTTSPCCRYFFSCTKDAWGSLFPVSNLSGAAAKLKTFPQQCCCVSHFHSHQLLVQPKQAVFKENLGARGAHSKTKAAIKYWCHKLHRLWISQSHSFLSQLKNCWHLAANYLAHGGRW